MIFSDKEIVSMLRAEKKEQAFNALVQEYKERLYWHIRRFTCSHEDADDLLQETFIKIWGALDSFKGASSLFTWVYKNVLWKKIDEDPYFNGNEVQRQLHKAIQKLPEKQRLVFNLRYFDELSYNEISEILNTSPGSLKASYHHAYVKIKDELEKYF